jgi:UDP-N-acetylmuramoyl-tripeptide--D-alanyl-D-alanine ligase
MKRTLAAAAAACGGKLQGVDAPYANVSTDTRTLARGDLFVALKGPNFDGHDFLNIAATNGAAGAVVSRVSAGLLPQVVVPDTLVGLTALAGGWRSQFAIPVVGVGGSNGKTTVKEMTASILSRLGPCLSTRGNLNNHIGVPLTLMRLDATHRSAVIEMGANRCGDVEELAKIARPTVGLITNAGAEHLEGFGDLDGVARGEGEMVASLPPDGVAVINADDAYASLWRRMSTAHRVVSFGLNAGADFRATDISQSIVEGEFTLQFTLHAHSSQHPVSLRLAGRHNVVNALAAAAAAHAAGAGFDAIVTGLQAVRAVSGRLQLKRAHCGAWIIDDSYNANPSSVQAALQVLEDLPGTKWMVLGDMAELGETAEQSHKDAGALARRHGVTRLFASGPLSTHAVTAFGKGADWFPSVEALSEKVSSELGAGTTLLIKGSRVNRLERVVAALMSADPSPRPSPTRGEGARE